METGNVGRGWRKEVQDGDRGWGEIADPGIECSEGEAGRCARLA